MVLTRPFGWRSTLMQFIPLRHFPFLDIADSAAETACPENYPWKIEGEENKLEL